MRVCQCGMLCEVHADRVLIGACNLDGVPNSRGPAYSGLRAGKSSVFGGALRRGRVVLLLEGFYEWQKPAEPATGQSKAKAQAKQPFYVYPKKAPPGDRVTGLLMVAGLWDCWGADELETATVITTAAEGAMQTLHDRQPAILTTAAQVAQWLDPTVPAEQALNLLDSTAAAEALAWHPVSSHVGKTSNDGDECRSEVKIKTTTPSNLSSSCMRNFLKSPSPPRTKNMQPVDRLNTTAAAATALPAVDTAATVAHASASGSAPTAVPGGAAMHRGKVCPRCTFLNGVADTACAVCLGDLPCSAAASEGPFVTRPSPPAAEESSVTAGPASEVAWDAACPSCTFLNPASAGQCGICLADLNGGPVGTADTYAASRDGGVHGGSGPPKRPKTGL